MRKTRLLTLLGVGGLGKTRLSLQVAAEVLDDYPEGVWFVELAAMTDERLVPQAIASVLGVKEEAGRPVIDALIKYVRDRHLLLILDNCEHLVHACAELAKRLLQSGAGREDPDVQPRSAALSRAKPSIPVPPLSVPDARRHDLRRDDHAMRGGPPVRRTRDGGATIVQVTEQNAPAVVEICHRLDGIPLAIELAAARVRALSVEQIAERVSDRFRLLTNGDRTALPRQQTLRALIDWSYDLLTEQERVAVRRRLAVFAGGWTLEAAEAVGSGDGVDRSEVLDLLADLVDKSLVMMQAGGGRYGLLETVRQYAQERLSMSGESDAVRKRHLDFYLAFVEKAGVGLAGPEQPAFLQQLDVDRENVLAAHAFCIHNAAAADSGYRLVHAIRLYWFTRGLLNLGHRVTVEAVSIPAVALASISRCKALWVAGQICSAMGRYEEAQTYLQESLSMARALDDLRMVVSVLNVLGLAALGQGDRGAARLHSVEALTLASKLDNKRQIAVASNALAQIHRLEGELDAAEPLYARTVALAREMGDSEAAAVGLLNLAMVAIERGAAKRARSLLLEVLTITEQSGSKRAGQCALEVSAGLAALREDWAQAARFYGVAERQTAYTGIRRDPADEAFLRPLMSRAHDALGEAAFAASQASAQALTYEQVIVDARAWLARDD